MHEKLDNSLLILEADSGYLTKTQLLPFLLANGLTDTSIRDWNKYHPKENDSVGKYYLSNNGDRYILLAKLLGKEEPLEMLAVLEVSKTGLLVNHTEHFSTDQWCAESAISTFCKRGKYFIVRGCGHGSGFSSEWGYVFDRVIPSDSLNTIYFGGYTQHSITKPDFPELITSDIEWDDTSILLHYTVKDGRYTKKDSLIWTTAAKTDVRYTRTSSQWRASDSTELRKWDME